MQPLSTQHASKTYTSSAFKSLMALYSDYIFTPSRLGFMIII